MIKVPSIGLNGIDFLVNDGRKSISIFPDIYSSTDERRGVLEDFLPVD